MIGRTTVFAASMTLAPIFLTIGTARAGQPTFPQYDIAKTCRTQADYAFAATLGQSDIAREIEACSARERENQDLAQALWTRASQKDGAECLTLAEDKYGYLARCLESARSIRTAR